MSLPSRLLSGSNREWCLGKISPMRKPPEKHMQAIVHSVVLSVEMSVEFFSSCLSSFIRSVVIGNLIGFVLFIEGKFCLFLAPVISWLMMGDFRQSVLKPRLECNCLRLDM